MPVQVGTYDISTLLAARNQSANAFGMDTIRDILQADLDAWNTQTTDAVGVIAQPTTERQTVYGTSLAGDMVEVDEYGRSATQRSLPGSTVGFPLRKFQYPVGWTSDFMKRATPADLAGTQLAAQGAYARAIIREVKRAIYTSGNYTFNDYIVNNVAIAVKRFVNADSAGIPNAPDGSTFNAATHTHYDAVAALSAAALTAAINDVVEHGHGGRVLSCFHFNDEATVRALTGFVPAPDYRVIPATNTTVTQQTTNFGDMYNRYIGVYGAAEVWIKPWAVQNYAFTFDADSPRKPLAFRQDDNAAFQGLRLAAQLPMYPLFAEFFEAYFGFGALTRTNGHVLYFAGGAYTDPTIS
jgi:hypothetical protein